MKILLGTFALLLTLLHVWLVVGSMVNERREITTRDDLRRLSKVTLQFFSKRVPPSAESFWRSIGRAEPLEDPWGTPYRLDLPSPDEFRWSSAGPDRKHQSADDLVSRIPFGDGGGIDFTQPHLEDESTPRAKSAI